jgi:hypothetical protein
MPLTIADLVEVAPVETVVRLDGRPGRLAELVLTADVAAALSAVLEAAPGGGGAFFLVGHFGSGKSHFLAALAELAADPAATAATAGWDPALRRAAAAADGPALAVPVPLVQHRAGAQLDDVVLGRAWDALGGPGPRPPTGTDRQAAWDAVLDAAAAAGRPRLLVLLDELSEFLRAKQGPALVEDLRFLQFLGEWARDRPVVVVGALQESIEEVANVSQRELARIRDRYRSLALSMRHVQDLVRGRLVRVRPGAEAAVEQAWRDLDAAFPGWGVPLDRFARCYPLHPGTLDLLAGLRFLFSQQRGVVDFICRQLLGDPASGIEPWQERGRLDLLTPDRVYDHFRARLHERVETRRLAETVVPYCERAVGELYDDDADRTLALRAAKLLCLLAASPLERPRTAAELAHLLLPRVSALDPAANVAYLEQAVLAPLVARGAYVVARTGPPPTYTVELEADAAEVALARIAQVRAEVGPGDRRIVRSLVELGSWPTLPLQLLADMGPSRRELLWQHTLRTVLVALVRVAELGPADLDTLAGQAQAVGAEGCVLVGELEPDAPGLHHLLDRAQSLVGDRPGVAVWVPAPLGPAATDAALDLHTRRLVLEQARAEGRTEAGGLVELLERMGGGDAVRAQDLLREAYFGGAVAYGPGGGRVDLASLSGLPFERLLVTLADPLLSRLHPLHHQVAPRGDLVGERLLRQLVIDVLSRPRITAGAAERGDLRGLIAGYLVPLGLVRRQGDAHVLAPDPSRSPAVAEALRLVPDGAREVPALDVVARLAAGPVGLTEPEALLVLNACVQAGLLQLRRGKRGVAEPFLALTPADRLSAGELLEPAARAALAGLRPVVGQGPFEAWNASVQQAVWEKARTWLEARREDAAQVRHGLAALADNPVLAEVAADGAAADLAAVTAVLDACDGGPDPGPVPGLRRLVSAVGDTDTLLAAAGRLAAVARFFRQEVGKVEQAAAYVTHPQLDLPAGDARLGALAAEARSLLGDVLALAAADRVGDLVAADREFRRAYAGTYRAAHDRFYTGAAAAEVERVRASPAYRALAALAGVGAFAVPDDRVKVDRALAAAVPAPCRRQLDLELSWKPRCSCGFSLGQEPPEVDAAGLTALAARGVGQHLAELGAPEARARLERAADDLAGLGRDELAADLRRLLSLVLGSREPDDATCLALAHLLVEPLAGVVRDVLAGGELVSRRDLAALREDLIGRRYPKRRLLDLLAAWVDPTGELPARSFVEVVDSGEGEPASAPPPEPAAVGGATAAFLARRFPRLAALLPAERPGEAFWLAAWWAGRPDPPAWLPGGLVAEAELLGVAAEAARGDLGARADLAELDGRAGRESLLGDQLAAALGLGDRTAAEVAAVLAGERLLRLPQRLAAGELVGRLEADWQLVERLPGLDAAALGAAHALAGEGELTPLALVLDAARHLARLERALAGAGGRELVEEAYPAWWSPVPDLLSRAEVAAVGGGVLGGADLERVRAAAARLLRRADEAFCELARAGFPGCLPIWEVGRAVVEPLLDAHRRVAVLLVDAMRADVWRRVAGGVEAALGGPDRRERRERWAVVPSPTRTAEAVAALYLGHQVPAGSAPPSPSDLGPPFPHLGVESAALVGVDRDRPGSSEALRAWWAEGPPVSVAVATGVDELLHRSSVELAGLLDEAVAGLRRRVVPTLAALPPDVPLVVLADHGFRERASWGRGPDGRYAHGGLSLEESVVPVAVFAPRQ